MVVFKVLLTIFLKRGVCGFTLSAIVNKHLDSHKVMPENLPYLYTNNIVIVLTPFYSLVALLPVPEIKRSCKHFIKLQYSGNYS